MVPPPYDGNPSKVFDWCGELENHLSRYKCDMIPNDTIKRMLLDCIKGEGTVRDSIVETQWISFRQLLDW